MLLRTLKNTVPFLFRPSASILIYLRDHNKHINPEDSKLKLSYHHPANLVPEAPIQKPIEYKLDPEMQQLLERQIFEEYKNKLLRGIIDEEKTKETDPLWGDQPAPVHYYNRTSITNLMRVSYPHNKDAEPQLESLFQNKFQSTYQGEITQDAIKQSDVHQLVEISMAARNQNINDRQIWFAIERGLKHGKTLYLLSSKELVSLKWAFDGKNKQGTPQFHQILSSLLSEDLPKMDKQLLLNLFYACRHSNPGRTNHQRQIIQLLRPLFKSFTFEEKVLFIFTFSLCTKSLKYYTKVQKRRMHEYKQLAASIILELDLWELSLTNQTVNRLVFALAKLHLNHTKFITYPLRDYISENIENYCADLHRLFNAIVYLGQLEAEEGVMDQQLGGRLRELAFNRWDQFSKIQQIRIIHAFWTIGLMDEALLDSYKAIELQADTSLLYYACQLQLSNSTQRQWQIIQLLAQIEYLPLPYFVAYKRFYNYIKATTQWNISVIADKLRNTEYHFSVVRYEDSLLNVKFYRRMREFEKFSGVNFSQDGAPIENLELAHFGYPLHKVSLDIVTKKQFIPGTTQLKQTYMNKVRSLTNIGWKHLAYNEQDLKNKSLAAVLSSIQNCYTPFIESQQAIIDYQDFKVAEEIEIYKQIEEMKTWDLDYLNSFLSKLHGKEDIKLTDDLADLEMKRATLTEPELKQAYQEVMKTFKENPESTEQSQ